MATTRSKLWIQDHLASNFYWITLKWVFMMLCSTYHILITIVWQLLPYPVLLFALILGWGCLPAPVRFVTPKPAIVFKAKYRGGNAGVGCLCVTQQSFALGCSPLAYILPPNHPAWPSCLHGNASVQQGPGSPHPPLLWWGREITPSGLPSSCCFSEICVLSLLSAALTFTPTLLIFNTQINLLNLIYIFFSTSVCVFCNLNRK